ncbi:MAG: hypothetical protein JXB60_07540 [Candidatus Cloacimonetes bacterium]|nr:hypothetical protein [Candidatus Cloacimonadota bacterium]
MKNRDYFNDLLILILAFLYLLPVLLSANWILNLFLLVIALLNLILLRHINFRLFIYFLLLLIIPVISVFITALIYSRGAENTPIIAYFAGLPIRELAWQNAVFLSSRTFALTTISFVFLLGIKYDRLVLSLMQNLKLPVSVGYALLTTFNAFVYLSSDYGRIREAYRMRFLHKRSFLRTLFPMLVSAGRYAYFAGLSLECRGLNSRKTFRESYPWQHKDTSLLLGIIALLAILMIIIIKKGIFILRWQ